MPSGVIYVLTNPSFPDFVKIGYADDLARRLDQLNRSECLPFAFRAYCQYEVTERLKDKDLHNLIDGINPSLRAIETFDGKPRVREFYNMTAEAAYDILYSIAAISGTTDRLKMVVPAGHEIKDEQLAAEIERTDDIIYTEEYHLKNGSESTIALYEKLKEKILSLDGITQLCKKLYIAFKTKTNIADIQLQKKNIKVYINLAKGQLDDKLALAKDISDIGHWGNGDYMIVCNDENNIDYIFDLIRQSYNKKMEQQES